MNNIDQKHTSENNKVFENPVTTSPGNQRPIIQNDSNLSSDFTARFKILLLQKGIRTGQLAKQVGISHTYMCHIIEGRNPARKLRQRICEILGIQITDLWEPEFCKKCGREIIQNAQTN